MFPVAEDAESTRRIGRRDNRALAMQVLFSREIFPLESFNDHWSGVVAMMELPEEQLKFARELAEGTIENLFPVNELLSKFLDNWSLERLEKVSLAILRLATYELLRRKDIPPAVTINEAIELCKTYADPDSKRIINGVLDRIRRYLENQCLPSPIDGKSQGGGNGLGVAALDAEHA
jgi:N utilization substance protein B